jgi:hypothetical protein
MHTQAFILTPAQKQEFDEEGLLIIKNFYDTSTEITPIQFGIWKIIGLIIKKYNLPVQQQAFSPATFDAGYQEIIAINRKIGGEIYDAVKQIPAFMRLVGVSKNEAVYEQLRGEGTFSGVAAAGYGIRIDNPHEEKFRSLWHYEYRDQLRSMDGVVFWSPYRRFRSCADMPKIS